MSVDHSDPSAKSNKRHINFAATPSQIGSISARSPSQRQRRPSARKLESDEYEASSRGSSRPPTPSQSKSTPKPKKYSHSKRGDRPGRIVQPGTLIWTTGDFGSPEPFAMPGSQTCGSAMAGQGPFDKYTNPGSRAEDIHRASDFLGVDASLLPAGTLQKVLATISDHTKDAQATPVEPEGGSAPAAVQSLQQTVIGDLVSHIGAIPLATANRSSPINAGPPTEAQRLAFKNSQADAAMPVDDDTATESETESELVELGPGDSVSQRFAPPPPPLPPDHRPPAPRHPGGLEARTNIHPRPVIATANESGSDSESQESDLESDGQSSIDSDHAPASKRPRLGAYLDGGKTRAPLSRITTSRTGLPAPCTSALWKAQPNRSRSLALGDDAPQLQTQTAPVDAPRTPPTKAHLASTSDALHSGSTVASQPLPLADVGAVLAYAIQMAERATRMVADTNPGGPSNQSGQPGNPYDAIVTVLHDVQSQLLASAAKVPSPRHNQPSSPTLGHMDTLEENSEALEVEASHVLGRHIPSHRKPTLDDFPGFPHRIASLAIPELLAIAFTCGPYEVFGTLCEWALEAYELVWRRELPNTPFRKPPMGLLRIMVHRISWYRGELKKRIRVKVESKFGFVNPPLTRVQRRSNRQLARKLQPNVFYCLDLEADVGAYEHPALLKCIAAGFFSAPDSLGMLYHNKFRPVPLPAVSAVLTTMQHCIAKWKTGRYVALDLNAGRQFKVYEAQLQGLLAYAKQAPKQLRDFRREWFWYGVACSGAPVGEEPPVQPITRADRIRPDTPEPASPA